VNSVFDILTSKAKAIILRTLYFQPKAIPLRHIAYLSDLPIFSVQHAIKSLLDNGIVSRKKEGNNVLFELNRGNPLYTTLQQFFIIELNNRIVADAKIYYHKAKAALDFANAANILLKRVRQKRTPK
jgi:DNA-binding transcriptional ArsR family regulator